MNDDCSSGILTDVPQEWQDQVTQDASAPLGSDHGYMPGDRPTLWDGRSRNEDGEMTGTRAGPTS